MFHWNIQNDLLGTKVLQFFQSCIQNFPYTPEIKYSTPYYISPIEIGLLWANITYLKSHSEALAFNLQKDGK